MKLDLSKEIIFKENELDIDNNVAFIYGQNGTGKSTLAKLIEEQNADKDVRIFDGFENLLGDNEKLNAVILGEENKMIDEQIAKKKEEIQELKIIEENIKAQISKPLDGKENFWSDWAKKQQKKVALETEIDSFYKRSASKIKNMISPQISSVSYDKNSFRSEIAFAKSLDEAQIKKNENILRATVKTASEKTFPIINYPRALEMVNEALEKKVEERISIKRLTNQDKKNFADFGRKIHSRGDICAFCGNRIQDSTFDELERFFSADEVKMFQNELQSIKTKLQNNKTEVESFDIDEIEFYDVYEDALKEIRFELDKSKEEQVFFIEKLIDAIENKEANLFDKNEKIALNLPDTFEKLGKQYNELVQKNNDYSLPKQQDEARKELRFHHIKKFLDTFNFEAKKQELYDAANSEKESNSRLEIEKAKINGRGGTKEKINTLTSEINDLIKLSKNEKILADNINKKLKSMVSFRMIPVTSTEGKGYYEIESLIDGTIRDIRKLSTGEKNIIAFLYYVEKLKEINPKYEKYEKRVVVFDDPMSSNDDNMQYLMMNELLEIVKDIKKTDNSFVLLTHNKHFYLNITYNREDEWKKYSHIHMIKECEKTVFSKISAKKDDFKNSYESLWKELEFLYSSPTVPASMLLNPIRRINETFYKFNGITANSFYERNFEAKKLFDVNSHSIDDLEAELNGKSKEQILLLMKSCYEKANATAHFLNHWSDAG